MKEKYNIGDTIVCIREYLSYRIGKFYDIKGSGGLGFNADPKVNGRSGWGVCVADVSGNWTYLDLNELEEYFITYDEYYKNGIKRYVRNDKLNQLGIK